MAENQDTPTTSAPEAPAPRGRKRGGPYRRAYSPTVAIAIDAATIQASIERSSSHCMIAEAIKKAVPTSKNVTVALDSIRFTDPVKRLRYTYLTPRAGQIALIHFDRGIRPEPFGFTLKTAAQITRSGGGSSGNKPKTAGEKRQTKENHKRDRAQRHAQATDQPFTPARAVIEDVVRRMDDPNADLGPPVAVRPPDGGGPRATVIIGGHPAGVGNLAKTRRFGIRQYLE